MTAAYTCRQTGVHGYSFASHRPRPRALPSLSLAVPHSSLLNPQAPIEVGLPDPVAAVAAGGHHTLALTSERSSRQRC